MKSQIVLMYHDIVTATDKSSGFQNKNAFPYKVEETSFEEQVKALQGTGVVFTFDDGGVSFYTKAAPILEKYGIKGVFFVSTKYIGTPGFLTAGQVKELAERGHIIGSHSHSHPPYLTALSKEEIKKEWQDSSKVLNDILGKGELQVSIPNGYASNIVLEEAIAAGATDIYTSQPTTGIKSFKGHRIIGRYAVYDKMSTQDVLSIVVSKSLRVKLSLKWHALNVAKLILGSQYDNIKAKIKR